MGNAYEQLKRYPETVAAYEQFLRLKPTGDLADSVRKDLPNLRRLAGK
jgi:regulator of sirC expression with transglutaminase-like and TPR domain